MVLESVAPRIKQPDNLQRRGIDRADLPPFLQRATNAGKRKILGRRLALRDPRNNVVEMKLRLLPLLWQAAVFARVSSPGANQAR
jgi:hypothetical protein